MLDDDADSLCIGVNPVRLHQRRLHYRAVEEEWIEMDLVTVGEVDVNLLECLAIVTPEIGRCEHAGQHDLHATVTGRGDDLVKIAAQLIHR